MAVPAKQKHRAKLLEYLSDPSNDFPSRDYLSLNVLKFAQRQSINIRYTHGGGADAPDRQTASLSKSNIHQNLSVRGGSSFGGSGIQGYDTMQ